MIYLITFILVMVVGSFGAYTMALYIIQSKTNYKNFEDAKWYLDELLKDLIFKRKDFFLHNTDFRVCLRNDVFSYLDPTDFERWNKRFFLFSQKGEDAGISQYGLPYYSVLLLEVSEDSRSFYEGIISTIASNCLALGHCTETRVYIEWCETSDKNFSTCYIIYARTANEQSNFRNFLLLRDKNNLGIDSVAVKDPELEEELKDITNNYDQSRVQNSWK